MGAAGSATGADEGAAAAATAAADAAAAQQAAAAKAAADAAAAASNKGRPKAPRQPTPPPAAPTFNVNGKNFMKRVEQVAAKEAEKKVMAALGCTLEEAKARLASAAAGNTGAAGPAATAANDAETKKIKSEKDRLERENQNLKGQIASRKSKDAARIQELEDTIEQGRVMDLARSQGFTDPKYAMYQLAEAQAQVEEQIDEAAFFTELKTKNPHLAGTTPIVTPDVRKVGATTAPAASANPGGQLPNTGAPNPAPLQGQAPGTKHVNDMTPEEFRADTEARFQYRPGR